MAVYTVHKKCDYCDDDAYVYAAVWRLSVNLLSDKL